ncbi:MAG TPA: VWA domain-containing protein [Bacteroidota bacterium]|nr:VWA domain-containing protein [Bacteroidota bacterium]
MTLTRTSLRLCFLLCVAVHTLCADGLMRPTDKAYPKNFLRTRMTRVDVTLYGQIAVTKVYQEFVNEWHLKTNAVYSFPLPADARATDFFFWANDTMYQASLKVNEQAVNPGTGEGGIDALLSAYLGKNQLRVLVNDVPALGIQKTQLEYISLCSYDRGRIQYKFPFNTQDFVTTPLESFSLHVRINAADAVFEQSLKEYPDAVVRKTDNRHIDLDFVRSKIIPSTDLTVEYRTISDSLTTELYAVDNDSLDGHFVMIAKPQTTLDTTMVLKKNVVFVIDASANAQGTSFNASKMAVGECLKSLRPDDRFNILSMTSWVGVWRSQSQQATAANLASASAYVAGLSSGGAPNLSGALAQALSMFTSDSLNNVVLLFSDGQSYVDPKTVTATNVHKAGIFPVAVGPNANRQRLEMLAYQNFGFPTFLALTDPLYDRILDVFAQINYPILKDVRMEFGPNVYDLLPQTLQTVYYGSRFFITGRFKNPGTGSLAIAGSSYKGTEFMNFPMNFPSDKSSNKFAERFWAKEKLDQIERQIAVYTVNDSLKQLAIKYSLMYRIRCQFTAYLADKTNPVLSGVESADAVLEDVSLAIIDAGAVKLTWRVPQSSEPIVSCTIYRSLHPGSGFVKLNDAPLDGRTRSFTDMGTNATSPTFYYKIELVTRSGKLITSRILSSTEGVVPAGFALHQNFPNPFNPETRIRFDVAHAGRVELTIYDVLGRSVVSLVDEHLQPGVHYANWNARAFPSGVYYCVMKSGSFSEVKKLILQK